MPHPTPEYPTNVQTTNPYQGLDRGVFIHHAPGVNKLARIHAAKWTVKGPAAAVGVLQYQIMTYDSKPLSQDQYASGNLLKAPDGGEWFNCQTRGQVYDAIMAEYWGSNSYLTHYAVNGDARLLEQDVIDKADLQAQVFVESMGRFIGLKEVQLSITFNAVAGKPLTRTDRSLRLSYYRNGELKHLDVSDDQLPLEGFDPVQFSIGKVKEINDGTGL